MPRQLALSHNRIYEKKEWNKKRPAVIVIYIYIYVPIPFLPNWISSFAFLPFL